MMESSDQVQNNLNKKNVLVISVSFMLLMGSYFTTTAIAQTLLESSKADDPSVAADGYISLAVVYAAFAVSIFVATPVVNRFNRVKVTLVFGSALYAVFPLSFIYPHVLLVYGASVIIGFVGGIVNIANGCFFAEYCSKESIDKCLGIYWTIMTFGGLCGSSFVFWRFQGSNHISYETRIFVLGTLAIIIALSSVSLSFLDLPDARNNNDHEKNENRENNVLIKKSICSSFLEPFLLLKTEEMWLVIPPSICQGLEMAYFEAIFPTTVGFSENIAPDTRKLVGLSGILIACGTFSSGIIFGMLGHKLWKSNRSLIFSIGCLTFLLFSFLLYLNHPDAAPLGPTKDVSLISPPSIYISLICAFLLGIGDGCISPQITASIGLTWPKNAAPALAIYRLFLAFSCAVGFLIGTTVGLHNQLLIFVSSSILATIAYLRSQALIAKSQTSVTLIQVICLTPEGHTEIKHKENLGSTIKCEEI